MVMRLWAYYAMNALTLTCCAIGVVGFVLSVLMLRRHEKCEMDVKAACYDGGKCPVYMTCDAAMADLNLPCDTVIPAHAVLKVCLNVQFDIPKGWFIKLHPRSSLLNTYDLLSVTGVIDSDYKDAVHIMLYNTSETDVMLKKGTRVSQAELCKQYYVSSWERKNITRTGGFGSTGQGEH